MKRCGMKNCEVPEEELQFNKNKSKKDGLNSVCRVCSKKRSKQYYAENKDKHKGVVFNRNKKYKQGVRKLVYDYLSENPCVDCGEESILVLEFDHLRDKDKEISVLINSGRSWEVVKREIDKCAVRCANCHRKKTAIDQKWYALEYLEAKLIR